MARISLQDLRERMRDIEEQWRAGPPSGLRVSRATWRHFLITRKAACPADSHQCDKLDCCLGTRCAIRAGAKGLTPDGDALPRKERPLCGAKTRARGECQMRVEPGKHRCRLHGGKSTGPKTEAGREKIREAQHKRWARHFMAQMRAD